MTGWRSGLDGGGNTLGIEESHQMQGAFGGRVAGSWWIRSSGEGNGERQTVFQHLFPNSTPRQHFVKMASHWCRKVQISTQNLLVRGCCILLNSGLKEVFLTFISSFWLFIYQLFICSLINQYILSFCIPCMGQTARHWKYRERKDSRPRCTSLVHQRDWSKGMLELAPTVSQELTARYSGMLPNGFKPSGLKLTSEEHLHHGNWQMLQIQLSWCLFLQTPSLPADHWVGSDCFWSSLIQSDGADSLMAVLPNSEKLDICAELLSLSQNTCWFFF